LFVFTVIVFGYPSLMMTASEAVTKAATNRKKGKLSDARGHYQDAAKLYREQNDTLAYAHAIRHIADTYQEEKDLVSAKPLYEEALEIYRSNLDTKLLDLANTVRPYALLLEEQGDLGSARELWSEARHLYDSLRIREGVSECNTHLSQLQRS